MEPMDSDTLNDSIRQIDDEIIRYQKRVQDMQLVSADLDHGFRKSVVYEEWLQMINNKFVEISGYHCASVFLVKLVIEVLDSGCALQEKDVRLMVAARCNELNIKTNIKGGIAGLGLDIGIICSVLYGLGIVHPSTAGAAYPVVPLGLGAKSAGLGGKLSSSATGTSPSAAGKSLSSVPPVPPVVAPTVVAPTVVAPTVVALTEDPSIVTSTVVVEGRESEGGSSDSVVEAVVPASTDVKSDNDTLQKVQLDVVSDAEMDATIDVGASNSSSVSSAGCDKISPIGTVKSVKAVHPGAVCSTTPSTVAGQSLMLSVFSRKWSDTIMRYLCDVKRSREQKVTFQNTINASVSLTPTSSTAITSTSPPTGTCTTTNVNNTGDIGGNGVDPTVAPEGEVVNASAESTEMMVDGDVQPSTSATSVSVSSQGTENTARCEEVTVGSASTMSMPQGSSVTKAFLPSIPVESCSVVVVPDVAEAVRSAQADAPTGQLEGKVLASSTVRHVPPPVITTDSTGLSNAVASKVSPQPATTPKTTVHTPLTSRAVWKLTDESSCEQLRFLLHPKETLSEWSDVNYKEAALLEQEEVLLRRLAGQCGLTLPLYRPQAPSFDNQRDHHTGGRSVHTDELKASGSLDCAHLRLGTRYLTCPPISFAHSLLCRPSDGVSTVHCAGTVYSSDMNASTSAFPRPALNAHCQGMPNFHVGGTDKTDRRTDRVERTRRDKHPATESMSNNGSFKKHKQGVLSIQGGHHITPNNAGKVSPSPITSPRQFTAYSKAPSYSQSGDQPAYTAASLIDKAKKLKKWLDNQSHGTDSNQGPVHKRKKSIDRSGSIGGGVSFVGAAGSTSSGIISKKRKGLISNPMSLSYGFAAGDVPPDSGVQQSENLLYSSSSQIVSTANANNYDNPSFIPVPALPPAVEYPDLVLCTTEIPWVLVSREFRALNAMDIPSDILDTAIPLPTDGSSAKASGSNTEGQSHKLLTRNASNSSIASSLSVSSVASNNSDGSWSPAKAIKSNRRKSVGVSMVGKDDESTSAASVVSSGSSKKKKPSMLVMNGSPVKNTDGKDDKVAPLSSSKRRISFVLAPTFMEITPVDKQTSADKSVVDSSTGNALSASGDASDGEDEPEDISDEACLRRHNEVLSKMRLKFSSRPNHLHTPNSGGRGGGNRHFVFTPGDGSSCDTPVATTPGGYKHKKLGHKRRSFPHATAAPAQDASGGANVVAEAVNGWPTDATPRKRGRPCAHPVHTPVLSVLVTNCNNHASLNPNPPQSSPHTLRSSKPGTPSTAATSPSRSPSRRLRVKQ